MGGRKELGGFNGKFVVEIILDRIAADEENAEDDRGRQKNCQRRKPRGCAPPKPTSILRAFPHHAKRRSVWGQRAGAGTCAAPPSVAPRMRKPSIGSGERASTGGSLARQCFRQTARWRWALRSPNSSLSRKTEW